MLLLKYRFLELTATVRANAIAMATSLRGYLSAGTLKTAISTISLYIRQIGSSFIFATLAGLAFVLSPIGAVLTAISLIAVFVALNIDRIRKAFKALYDFVITNRLKPFFEGIKIGLLYAQKGIEAIKSAFKPLADALVELKKALAELLKPFKPLFIAIGKLFGFDGSAFKGWLEAGVSLGKLLAGVFNVFSKVVAVALKPAIWLLTGLVKLVTLVVKGITWVINGFRKLFSFLSRPLDFRKSVASALGLFKFLLKPLSLLGSTLLSLFKFYANALGYLKTAFSVIAPRLLELLTKPFKALGNLIWSSIAKVKSALDWLLNLFRKAFSFLKRLNPFNLGKWLIEGLAKGIRSVVTQPVEAIKGVAHKVVGWFKNLLGIKSPSRVFMGFGFNLLEGLFEGMRVLGNSKTNL